MVRKIIFKNIKFNNLDHKNFNKLIIKKGLFVFPAGPALASIEKSVDYYNSIKKADLVFFDSGLFNPPNSTVPTARNPWFIGVNPKPLSKKITGLFIKWSISL